MVQDVFRNPVEPLQLKLHQLHLPFRFEKTFPEQLSLEAADDNLSQVSPIQVSRCPEITWLARKQWLEKLFLYLSTQERRGALKKYFLRSFYTREGKKFPVCFWKHIPWGPDRTSCLNCDAHWRVLYHLNNLHPKMFRGKELNFRIYSVGVIHFVLTKNNSL